MLVIALALILITVTQSPATMAAVAVFAANAERKWPADEREPLVTAEALRLMEAAATSIADDSKINTGKVHDAIVAFSKARLVAADRDALLKGQLMIDAIAIALHQDAAGRQQLLDLKKSVEAIDRKKELRQQADVVEKYFHDAAVLLRTMLNAGATT